MVLKRRWRAFGVAAWVAAIGAFVVALVPDRYEAVAQVYVDTQTVLKPLMVGLTYQPDVDQQVRMLARTLISRPNLDRLVRLPELHFDVGSDAERDKVVANLIERIKVSATGSSNLYEISYKGASPAEATALVRATVDLFVHSGSGDKKRDAQDAGRFIEEQIRTYEAKLQVAEGRLKDFKVRNFGASGVPNQDYFARVASLGDEVTRLRTQLNAEERARDAFRMDLAAEEPLLPAGAGLAPSESELRLAELKRRLEDLLRRYTPLHPDVQGTQFAIAQLETELRERRAAEERAVAKTGGAATSPIYQRLRVSLSEAEAKVASLRSQLAAQQDRLDQARSLAGRVPQVEAELVQLNRDYDVIRKNYDEMVARRESASLGARLDESSQLADFRLVEPPRASTSPVRPSRAHWALVVLLASLVAGAAAAVLGEMAKPTFEDADELRAFAARSVAGTVTLHVTSRGKMLRRLHAMLFTTAVGTFVLLQVAWVAWLSTSLHPR